MDGSRRHTARIVVTGRGVVSAIGTDIDTFEASLAAGAGGIRAYDDLLPGQTSHVGLAGVFTSPPGLAKLIPEGCDRTAQLAAAAVQQALSEAGLWDGRALTIAPEEIALLLGSSHGGRSQLDRFVNQGMDEADRTLAHGVLELGAHYQQSAVVAAVFGIHGPVTTLSTACSSSGTAIAHAIDLLRTGQVRAVIAGGADAFSQITLAGFAALGAVADGPCGPFGSRTGISLGEGAAFVVLERHDDAAARDAKPLAEMFGCATTWDAHHLTAPEPSGDGMRRAIEAALTIAGVSPASIDYISAHGTGTRANDIAETLAVKRVFADGAPPVSATKSFTGHTLGASSAAGLLAGIAGARAGWLPPTINFGGSRAGCDLDYVPDTARPAEVSRFLALSAAFGGCNCAIVAGQPGSGPVSAPAIALDGVVITGMGVISTLGCDATSAFAAMFDGTGDWGEGTQTLDVRGFDPRRHLPRGRAPRMNAITQFSVAAIEQALTQAGWTEGKRRPTATGLMVGLSRGAAASFQACLESVRGGAWGKASPIAFPNLVMSSVGGQASVAVGMKGAASTVVGEAEVGLSLLGQAATLLSLRPDLDALVVLAADELTPLFQQLQQSWQGPSVLPMAPGAVALVLERRSAASARGAKALAELAGWAQSFDGVDGCPDPDAEGVWLEHAVRTALGRAGEAVGQVDLAMTLARGDKRLDRREAAALLRVFGNRIPPTAAVSGHAGWAEASGGLLAVAMTVMALHEGRLPAPSGRLAGTLGTPWLSAASAGRFAAGLVAGSSRHGNNAAVLIRHPGRSQTDLLPV
jgi:3-oxoacyl-[acyl-carrier-protein] synthase II